MRRVAVLLIAACGVSARLVAQSCPPPGAIAPVAQSPSNTNVTPNTPVTFSWTAASPTPTGYQVFVDGNVNSPACLTPNTSCTVNSGVPAGKHTWFVRSLSSCNSDSAAKTFTAGCPTTAPAQQFPANGTSNVSVQPTFSWSAVADADQYDIVYGKSGTGVCTNGTGTLATSTTTSFNAPPLSAGTTYEWKVAAKRNNTSCPAVLSTSCFTFTTACPTPGSFNLTAPSNNDTTSPTPTFTWSASSGAD